LCESKLRKIETCPICGFALSAKRQTIEECPQCHGDLEVHRLLSELNAGDYNMPNEKTKHSPMTLILGVQTALLAIGLATLAYAFVQTNNQYQNLEHGLEALRQEVSLQPKSTKPQGARASGKNALAPMLQQLLTLYQQERQERFVLAQKLVKLREKLQVGDREPVLNSIQELRIEKRKTEQLNLPIDKSRGF